MPPLSLGRIPPICTTLVILATESPGHPV